MITQETFNNLDPKFVQDSINEVGPDVMEIFNQFKTELGGVLPAEISYGIVCGYLHGKGFDWTKSFLGMNKFILVAKELAEFKDIRGFEIAGNKDGSVKVSVESELR